jgi:hypothetical protein
MDALLIEAFRIYCRFLAEDFLSFTPGTDFDAMLSPFFRKSARTFASYSTISEAYALVWALNDAYGDAGDSITNSLNKILDAWVVFYDDDSPFGNNLEGGADYYVPSGIVEREVTSWFESSTSEPNAVYWRNIKLDVSILENRENEKRRKYAIMKEFQKYIVYLNSTIHIHFKESRGIRRVVPRVHFLFLDYAEINEYYLNEWYGVSPGQYYTSLGPRERDMFLRAVFLEHDFVVIPFFEFSDYSTVRLVVVGFGEKVS